MVGSCLMGIGTDYIEEDGVTISCRKVCSCLIDEIMAKLPFEELQRYAVSNSYQLLIASRWDVMLACIGLEAEEEPQRITRDIVDDEMKQEALTACVDAILDGQYEEVFTEEEAVGFCSCVLDRVLAQGYTFADLDRVEDEDGAVYNEVILKCLEPFLGQEGLSSNTYNPSDIRGGGASTQVTLLNYLSVGKKIKMSFGGVERYLLFDTGASEVIITSEVEQQLRARGSITDDNYLGNSEYQLADGSYVMARHYVLNDVRVGDYVIDNLVVAVLDEGGMLCGLGLLNKFRKWEIKDNNLLILYR